MTVYVLSDHVNDSLCPVGSCDLQFMYCQIMGWSVHVLSDHVNDSLCPVGSCDLQFMHCQIM